MKKSQLRLMIKEEILKEDELKQYGIKKLRGALTIEKIKKRCPWILKAKIKDADIGWTKDFLEWYDGTWISGTWKDGNFRNGIWKNGIWESGSFYGKIWENGTWKKGNFFGKTWKNGTWENGYWGAGTWENGTWKNGRWSTGIWKKGKWIKGQTADQNMGTSPNRGWHPISPADIQ